MEAEERMGFASRTIEKYFKELERGGGKVVGVYGQGSTFAGFADDGSDIDYIVVWDKTFPPQKVRQKVIEGITEHIDHVYDPGWSDRGLELFYVDGIPINVVHVPVSTLTVEYNVEHFDDDVGTALLTLGGLRSGEIVYDPDGKVKELQSAAVLGGKAREKVLDRLVDKAQYPVAELQKLARREKSAIRFLKTLVSAIKYLSLAEVVAMGEIPATENWYERVYPDNDVTKLLGDIEKKFDRVEIANRVSSILKSLSNRS